jgi:hypothetical protein
VGGARKPYSKWFSQDGDTTRSSAAPGQSRTDTEVFIRGIGKDNYGIEQESRAYSQSALLADRYYETIKTPVYLSGAREA